MAFGSATGDTTVSGTKADLPPEWRLPHQGAALTAIEREALETHAAAYALDALEDAEAAVYERYWERCALCRSLVRDQQATASHLADAAGTASASPASKIRLMTALHEHFTPPASRPASHAPVPARRTALALAWRRRSPPPMPAPSLPATPWLWRPWPVTAKVLVASLALMVVGVSTWGIALRRQLSTRTASAAAYQATRTADARGRFVRIVALTATGGTAKEGYAALVVPASGSDDTPRLIAAGLPLLPAERAYQVWFIHNGVPRDAGTFRGAEQGLVVVPVRGDTSLAQMVALTVEPAGGSAAPTTPPILAGRV